MSNIKKHERDPSDLDFMHNALKLRSEMMNLLLRDFGIKK